VVTAYPSVDEAFTHVDRTVGYALLTVDRDLLAHGLDAIDTGIIDQIDCERVLQFLTGAERVRAFNEFHRVLRPGGKVRIVVPYHSHPQAYAHPYVQWPPISEHSFLFLDQSWRSEKAERFVDGLTCDFEVGPFSYDYDLRYKTRSEEWLANAVEWFHGIAVYLHVWLTKRGGSPDDDSSRR